MRMAGSGIVGVQPLPFFRAARLTEAPPSFDHQIKNSSHARFRRPTHRVFV
jgi:hypothetical protein